MNESKDYKEGLQAGRIEWALDMAASHEKDQADHGPEVYRALSILYNAYKDLKEAGEGA